jgi:hypothetical protein
MGKGVVDSYTKYAISKMTDAARLIYRILFVLLSSRFRAEAKTAGMIKPTKIKSV